VIPYIVGFAKAFGLAFAVLIWCVVGKPNSVPNRMFDNRILRWAGRLRSGIGRPYKSELKADRLA
jgi:hypothetical protein